MRDFIDLIDVLAENSLQPGVLYNERNGSKYLEILVGKMAKNQPLEIDPSKKATYGHEVYAKEDSVSEWSSALINGKQTGKFLIPKTINVKSLELEKDFVITPGSLFKSSDYTGLTKSGATAKDYNAGHINELIVGLACTAKFFNLGAPITKEQIITMASHAETKQEAKGITFSLSRVVTYPEPDSKQDRVNLTALIPTQSALSFIRQMNEGQIANDIQALFAGAIKYANESYTVATACDVARQDPNNNLIEVVSDGTTDAKGTKADITLSIDGADPEKARKNLLSLKTTASDTMGQISGLKYENIHLWFKTNFKIDISLYKDKFDQSLDKKEIYKNLVDLYDTVIYPQVKQEIEDQTPQSEAKIVKHLADAANFYARGEKLEDVEVVKLDDSTLEGNYKILRFTNNLYDAMKYLDLETRYVSSGQGRTIQIWVKPAEGVKVPKGSNRLCQFRTQPMGGYVRNFFEIGPMMEALTEVTIEPKASSQPKDIGRPRRA